MRIQDLVKGVPAFEAKVADAVEWSHASKVSHLQLGSGFSMLKYMHSPTF